MIINKALARNFKIKKQNLNRMKNILAIIKDKISNQGSGCFIPNQGVAYWNPKNSTRDPIGHLLTVPDLKGHFGPIYEEAQKSLLRKIINKFQIDVSRDAERTKFITFLQDIQDAHDDVFDEFQKLEPVQNRIPLFLGACNQIAFNYGVN